jgi:hypothetical protein
MGSHTTGTIDYLHAHIPRSAFSRLYWIEHWQGRAHGLLDCSVLHSFVRVLFVTVDRPVSACVETVLRPEYEKTKPQE